VSGEGTARGVVFQNSIQHPKQSPFKKMLTQEQLLKRIHQLSPIIVNWMDTTVVDRVDLKDKKDLIDRAPIAPIITTGFLLSENDDYILLASECFIGEVRNTEDLYRQSAAIPKAMVVERQQLIIDPKKEDFVSDHTGNLDEIVKTNKAIVYWNDAMYLRDSKSRTKQSILKQCVIGSVLTTGIIIKSNADKTLIAWQVNTDKNMAHQIQTIPTPAINRVFGISSIDTQNTEPKKPKPAVRV